MARPGDKRPRSKAARAAPAPPRARGESPPRAGPPIPDPLARAFDEARFGADRTLNLRESLPTGAEASGRAEAWLRTRQAVGGGEVLLITGRGRGSLDGVPIVRDAVLRLFTTLRRTGVILAAREHGPGAFVVDLAPLQALVDAPRRRRKPPPARPLDPVMLAGLESDTRELLRRVALAALHELGVHEPSDALVADEMIRQFASLAASVPPGPSREISLRTVVRRALEEFE